MPSDLTSAWAWGCLGQLVAAGQRQSALPAPPHFLLHALTRYCRVLAGAPFKSVPLVWNAFSSSPGYSPNTPCSAQVPSLPATCFIFPKHQSPTVIGPVLVFNVVRLPHLGQGQLC